MSVIQSNIQELRYLNRTSLEEEARVVGNYYRDIIRSYGIDCTYHKLDMSDFGNFKNIIDQNTILRHAYGYNISPDYSVSAKMLTYMEVDNDVILLNKLGSTYNTDSTFYFDSNDFACDLATKAGQFKEYPIQQTEIVCEVPECISDYEEYPEIIDPNTKQPIPQYLSANIFPYNLGLVYEEGYKCQMLSGKLRAQLNGYQVGTETSVICDPYEHTDFNVTFSSNSDLYKSLKYKIENDDYLETMIFLKFKVNKIILDGFDDVTLSDEIRFIPLDNVFFIKNALKRLYRFLSLDKSYDLSRIHIDEIKNISQLIPTIQEFARILECQHLVIIKTVNDIKTSLIPIFNKAKRLTLKKQRCKYILKGTLFGSILFFDADALEKYAEQIHPMVGDLVTIDFPDEKNREQYEITECINKDLTQSGISPLLHKYIWKCKARRYINTGEDMEHNEANERLQEKMDYDAQVNQQILKKISKYDDNEDSVYGGFELDAETVKSYDKEDVRNSNHESFEYINDGYGLDLIKFQCGSKLCTTGYDLLFVDSSNQAYKLTMSDQQIIINTVVESGLKYLKATKESLIFSNIAGESYKIIEDEEATQYDLQLCLNSLYDLTLETKNINSDGDNFYKFKECKTLLWATPTNLYCKLESNGKLYKLV